MSITSFILSFLFLSQQYDARDQVMPVLAPIEYNYSLHAIFTLCEPEVTLQLTQKNHLESSESSDTDESTIKVCFNK